MWEDPIVAEVHRTREQLAAESNFDIGTFFAGVRKRQATLGSRLVRVEPAAKAAQSRHPGIVGVDIVPGGPGSIA